MKIESPGKKGKGSKKSESQNVDRTMIIFNPILWREETVYLIED